jgi:class 3 adenylate cyclase/CHASE2 domain-containing sensor protein
MEWGSVDFRFFLRDPAEKAVKLEEGVKMGRINPRANKNIVILGIDENTVRDFSDRGINWPFPWNVHAKFTRFVGTGNPLAIFFDVMFLDHKEHEEDLAKAIEGAENVFLDYPLETEDVDTDYKDQAERLALMNRVRWRVPSTEIPVEIINDITKSISKINKDYGMGKSSSEISEMSKKFIFEFANSYMPELEHKDVGKLLPKYFPPKAHKDVVGLLSKFMFKLAEKKYLVQEAVPPTPRLIRSAKGIGFANVFPGRDKINRTMPLVLEMFGWYYPNIDLVIAMQYYGITRKDVEIKIGEYIKLKNLPKEKMAKLNDKREIIIPIDNYGFMNINFIGGSGSFQHYSYNLFYREGSMKGNDSLKDKILLVAAYASTGIATDEKRSPYGASFGIEHHANALNTILNQDFLNRFSDKQNIIIMLVLALILGILLPKVSIVVMVVFTTLLSILYVIASYLIFDSNSIITAMASPIIQIGITFTLITAYRVLTEQKEKKYIRSTFSKFVSKSVVDELLKHPDKLKLGGDKKILTVLFSDIRGFTSISEQLTPEELVEHLNIYLQEMTEQVFKYQGTLDKYVGDEIMAFWGAPIPFEDHALQACKSAIEQMKKLHELNARWEAEGKPSLNIGIGLNTGPMVVGNMGSSSRMDYTLMGDNVNLGARLEGTNKVYGTNIIISQNTYEHVKDQVVVRELDLIRVKGKEQPVVIYELVDIKE